MHRFLLASIALVTLAAPASAEGPSVSPDSRLQTGRSVATQAARDYWLSEDLNRLFLQTPRRPADQADAPTR